MPYDVDLNCRERADLSLGNLIPRETGLVLKIKRTLSRACSSVSSARLVPISSFHLFHRLGRGMATAELGSTAKGDAVHGEDRSSGGAARRR
jgi:hypothetical protein